MAAIPQIPPPNPQQPPIPVVASAAPRSASNLPPMPEGPPHQALVPAVPDPAHALHLGELDLTGPLALLPIELDVSIPVREFRVRQLLALEPGQLIETQWHNGDDVPLAAADVHLAWSEFEVIESELAVRVTRLP